MRLRIQSRYLVIAAQLRSMIVVSPDICHTVHGTTTPQSAQPLAGSAWLKRWPGATQGNWAFSAP